MRLIWNSIIQGGNSNTDEYYTVRLMLISIIPEGNSETDVV